MKILIEVPDNFTLEEGDAFDAVQTALEHFDIPSAMLVVTDDAERKRFEFAEQVANLKMWDYSNDSPGHFGECTPPSDGYDDSHSCLMKLIEEARVLTGQARSPIVKPDEPADNGNELVAASYLQQAMSMSTDELDDWYEQQVGYRPSQDDPALIGNPEHAYLIAETMCLREHGPKGTYGDLCVMLEQLRTGSTDGRHDKYFPAPVGLIKRLSQLPGKTLESDFKTAVRRLTYPYFELSQEQYEQVKALAGDSDVLLFDGTTQVTFGGAPGKFGLMPLFQPL